MSGGDTAPAPGPVNPKTIVEFCCEEDSRIGETAPPGCTVKRLTKRDRIDTRAGYKKASKLICGACGPTLLWGAMPCTGGCAYSHINLSKGGATAQKVMFERDLFDRLWHNFEKAARATHAKGGSVAIEWPKTCIYWRLPEVQALMRNLGMEMVECHGCAFGVVDQNGRPLKKLSLIHI